jgi:16S rRNA (guanine966-N2)-methyltransferase
MPVHKTMRITGGKLVRRRFLVPPMVDEGSVRPTPDRVREAVFSMLLDHLPGARILDLFAGSGAHGFEAISRGAALVKFIERDPRVAAVIKTNIENLGISDSCTLEIGDALKAVQRSPEELFDIIFVDPPYSLKLDENFFSALKSHCAKEGLVVFRCFKKEVLPSLPDFAVVKDRIYGGTRVFILQATKN